MKKNHKITSVMLSHTLLFRLLCCLLCAMSATVFFGCKKHNNKAEQTSSINLNILKGNKDDLTQQAQLWHVTDKKLCVVFGYDFNNPQTLKPLLSLLQQKYGLAEDGGLIVPLVYPNDFKHGVKGYASDLFSELQEDEKDFCGIVILGAPENTHKALAKNQDSWEQKVPYPVVALFPQDDVLGLEATCDIVVDKGQQANITGDIEPEEIEGKLIEEAPQVLLQTIDYLLCLEGPLKKDSTVQTHTLQMLKGFSIHHYSDPETGLQSINHFVIMQ